MSQKSLLFISFSIFSSRSLSPAGSKGLTCLFQQRLQRRYLTFYLVKLYHCLTSFSVLYGAAAVAADYGCIVPCKCAEKIRCPCDIHVRAASRSLRSRASLAKILLAARHLAEQNVLTGDTPAALSRFQRATRGESSSRSSVCISCRCRMGMGRFCLL